MILGLLFFTKMNLALEIRTDRKRNLEILPSSLLLSLPSCFFFAVVTPLYLAHFDLLILSDSLEHF
jgi:hypothetical protein